MDGQKWIFFSNFYVDPTSIIDIRTLVHPRMRVQPAFFPRHGHVDPHKLMNEQLHVSDAYIVFIRSIEFLLRVFSKFRPICILTK